MARPRTPERHLSSSEACRGLRTSPKRRGLPICTAQVPANLNESGGIPAWGLRTTGRSSAVAEPPDSRARPAPPLSTVLSELLQELDLDLEDVADGARAAIEHGIAQHLQHRAHGRATQLASAVAELQAMLAPASAAGADAPLAPTTVLRAEALVAFGGISAYAMGHVQMPPAASQQLASWLSDMA